MARTPGSKNKIECVKCNVKYQAHMVKDGVCSFCRQTSLLNGNKRVEQPVDPVDNDTKKEVVILVDKTDEVANEEMGFVFEREPFEKPEANNLVKEITNNMVKMCSEIDKVVEHQKICDELNALFEKKNHDYGDSFSETYQKLGVVSAVSRIYDKTNRLCKLTTNEKKVLDESIRDTLIDLANYAIMTVMEIDKHTR